MQAENWNILIVEDEFDSAQMVSKIIKHHGASLRIASNGIECLHLLEEDLPDLVIMDLAMPKMDGWQTLEAMRRNKKTSHIPVVAVTAYYSDEVEENVSLAGFDAYFTKPIDPLKFVNDIAHLIQK